MSIDLIQSLRELLEDHRHLELNDGSNIDYLAGLIAQMLDDEPNDQQMELFKGTTSEKISSHKIDGIDYGDDEKGLTDDFPLENKRRVKSYGFFKNEYYDD